MKQGKASKARKKPVSELEKLDAFGDPFYGHDGRHFRGQRTAKNENEIHPALVVGEWPSDYLVMGGQTKEPSNAKQRKKLIPLEHLTAKNGKKPWIRKQIEVREKRNLSPEKYITLFLTPKQHEAVDKQIDKKRAFWQKEKSAVRATDYGSRHSADSKPYRQVASKGNGRNAGESRVPDCHKGQSAYGGMLPACQTASKGNQPIVGSPARHAAYKGDKRFSGTQIKSKASNKSNKKSKRGTIHERHRFGQFKAQKQNGRFGK